jgi:hypothetical protein
VAQINEAIDRWAVSAITDKLRTQSLALELARLDELQEIFYQHAKAGDVQSAQLVT